MAARNRILPVFIPHLGCPHACVFCNQHEITGAAAAQAAEELNRIIGLPPVTGECELAFYGGSFTALPVERQIFYLELAGQALAAGSVSSVRLSTRPDAIDGDTLRRLRFYGVKTVEIGAQSMLDTVLKASGRGHTAEDVRAAARMIRGAGFRLVLQMMTGLPGDSDEGSLYTARELIALKPDAVRIYPAVIVKDTRLERMWREGSYREHSVEDAVRICSKILPLFEQAGTEVIRLGLNPTEELSRGGAVAGAYHPALGELVRSRILRDRAEQLLESEPCEGRNAVIRVPVRELSQMIGQKRENVDWLKERFALQNLRVLSDPHAEMNTLKLQLT